MLGRARNFLSTGDVAAARVVLRQAAASDDPQAALALGGTYDPAVLNKLGIFSLADPAQAREWYRKAAALGSTDALLRLEQLAATAPAPLTADRPPKPPAPSYYTEKYVEDGEYHYRRRVCEPPNMPDVCFMPQAERQPIVVTKP
jgi:TPR repeat protein